MTIVKYDDTPVNFPIHEIYDANLYILVQEQFSEALRIFGEAIQQERRMCLIYDAFEGVEGKNHNCLGCNLDEMTDQVLKFLHICTYNQNLFLPQQSFSIYATLLNGIWERISDVFKIISLPEGYRARHFQPFIRVRRWANFFKHPKAFGWMIHHPVYTFEASAHSELYLQDDTFRRIDDAFVKRFYASKEKTRGLVQELEGYQNKTVVMLPDLGNLTSNICDSLNTFIDIITNNPVYKEILDEKSTFTDYYEEGNDCIG